MCCLLVDQFTSVFTIPIPNKLLLTQFYSLPMSPLLALTNHCFLTDSMLNEDIIIVLPCYPQCYCLFFSHSVSHGAIPKSWKIADIIPIYKSGDKTVPSNDRPISLTYVICKVLERIIRKQVFSFLDQKDCLNSTQHGFRPGRSCLSALFNVLDNIIALVR